jgi:hypothetical protein
LLITPATKAKPRGQERTVKMSGCNQLWSVCAKDPTGLCSQNVGGQPAGGPLAPPALAKSESDIRRIGC